VIAERDPDLIMTMA